MCDPAPLTRFVIVVFMLNAVFSTPQSVFSKEHRPPFEAGMRQTGNQISGHVFDDSRRPVPQMYVELMNDLYQTIARTRTDNSGFYVFNHLSSGHFKIKVLVTGTGYTEQVQDVEINNFTHQTTTGTSSSKEFREQDFYLRLKEESRGVATNASPGVVFAQEVPTEAKKIYEDALRDLDAKRDAQGLQELKKSIELFPKYYAALERLGTEYARRGEYVAAVILLRKAIEVYPKGYQSLYSLGVALYNLNDLVGAIDMFDRATAISPNSVNSQLWLGKAMREKGQYDKAEAHLKRANELGKNRVPETHWQLALLYNHTKRNHEAADELETYLKLKPDAPNADSIREMIKKLREKTS
ncbi:MAG TPA: tetratricopeptide repeat protein [Pyrinomonadaceae bacterium]|jgi:tetratricopeptide (TPR) repeat protein|nr:tetratricopeptide repeat protein [Pyrinomonadaceae bacterium]